MIRFVTQSAFFICDAMEQMVDETAVRDKGRKQSAVAEAESSAWVRGGEFMWLRRRKQNMANTKTLCHPSCFWNFRRGPCDINYRETRPDVHSLQVTMRVVGPPSPFSPLIMFRSGLKCENHRRGPSVWGTCAALMSQTGSLEQNLKNASHACRPYFSIS